MTKFLIQRTETGYKAYAIGNLALDEGARSSTRNIVVVNPVEAKRRVCVLPWEISINAQKKYGQPAWQQDGKYVEKSAEGTNFVFMQTLRNIYLYSEAAGKRVMKSVTEFLDKRLSLKVAARKVQLLPVKIR